MTEAIDPKRISLGGPYPGHAYPEGYAPGQHRLLGIGWDIMDRLPPGLLTDAQRDFLCGLIVGSLSRERDLALQEFENNQRAMDDGVSHEQPTAEN